MELGTWKQWNLLHAVYPANDSLGKFLAFLSTTPLVIVVGLLTLIVFRRDVQTICLFSGILLNELLNTVLKRSLKQPRPPMPFVPKPSTYGMPSSHAQFMGFFCTYCCFFIIYRLHRQSPRPLYRSSLIALCLISGVLTCWSRIYLHYHSHFQVWAGLTIGSTFGLVWYFFVKEQMTPVYPRICDSYVGRVLMLQDFTNVPDIFEFEYNNSSRWNQAQQHTEQHKKSS